MKLIQQRVPADAVLKMINARLEVVTMNYSYAKGSDQKVTAEALAETKWQLAELKMQFLELLTDLVEESLAST